MHDAQAHVLHSRCSPRLLLHRCALIMRREKPESFVRDGDVHGASDTFVLGEQRRMPMLSLYVGSAGRVGYEAHGIFVGIPPFL